MASRIRDIAQRFDVSGDLESAEPLAAGHIHDSYLVTFNLRDGQARYLLQRINGRVFLEPRVLMQNIVRVTAHLSGKGDAGCPTLSPVAAVGGGYLYDDGAACWRLYRWIEGAVSWECTSDPELIRRAAGAYGRFQRLLLDLPADALSETIAGFHNTPARYAALQRAVRDDSAQRLQEARTEVAFALDRRSLAGAIASMLSDGQLPRRVAHNDAKLGNVLFDRESGEVLCVVDLDTVMPGTVLYDFGDMMRSMTVAAGEDTADPEEVELRLPQFEALVRGYLQEAHGFITQIEMKHLVPAGQIMTLEQGVRFLTDYLDGDRYYRIARPRHNLDRCRVQFKLVDLFIRQRDRLHRCVKEIAQA